MQTTIKTILPTDKDFPDRLRQCQPPLAQLYIQSQAWQDILVRPRVAIIGSRKISTYGKTVTHQLAFGLAQAGVVIVSGLAFGVDICAHRAALEAGGQTIAVLPSSIEAIYPRSHTTVAKQIIEQGGALMSEYPAGSIPYPSNFIARNRIVAGLSDIVVVTEAAAKSGTLHTTRFALEQGIDVLAVPGNITSPTSQGTNMLLRSGAGTITELADIFAALGIESSTNRVAPKSNNPVEQCLLDLLVSGMSDGALLLAHSKLDVSTYNQALTMLEISGVIRPLGGNNWQLA